MPELLTASRLRVYRDCARKHDLMYRQGYRPVQEVEQIRFGILLHRGLEAWWLAVQGQVSERLDLALNEVGRYATDDLERIKAEELLIGYETRWRSELDSYDVLAVEPKFEAALLNPETMAASRTWRLAGRIDAVLRRRDTGRLLVREFKTTSEAIDSDADLYWQKLAMDHQLSIYVIGGEALSFHIDECLYDVIRKPLLRRKEATPEESRKYTKAGTLYAGQRETDETLEEFRERLRAEITEQPNKYFQRRVIPRMNSQIKDFLFDTWQTSQQINEAQRAGRAPRNPDACLRYNSRCPFWDVCANGLDIETSDQFRKVANIHPELEEDRSESETRNAVA